MVVKFVKFNRDWLLCHRPYRFDVWLVF